MLCAAVLISVVLIPSVLISVQLSVLCVLVVADQREHLMFVFFKLAYFTKHSGFQLVHLL